MSTLPISQKQDSCCADPKEVKTAELKLPIAPQRCAGLRFAPPDNLVRAILPSGALAWLDAKIGQGAVVEAVNLSGPGDPLQEIGPTIETLQLLRRQHPDLAVKVTTLGLHTDKCGAELLENGVKSITLLVDAVAPEIAKNIYGWIRPGRKNIPLSEGVPLLMEEQRKAALFFIKAGCPVNISTTVYPGYNDKHIAIIAQTFAGLGAEFMTLIPCRPAVDPAGDEPLPPNENMMTSLSKLAGKYLKIVVAQAQSKVADDLGCNSSSTQCLKRSALLPKPSKAKPNVAVASMTGMDIDLHLGQAGQFLIYGPRDDGLACLLETRAAPQAGAGDERWQSLAEGLHDCYAVMVSGAGSKPRKILGEHGITLIISEDEIEGMVDVLYGGGKKKKC